MRILVSSRDADAVSAVEQIAADRGYTVAGGGTAQLIVVDADGVVGASEDAAVIVAVVEDDAAVEAAARDGAAYVLVRPVDAGQVGRVLTLAHRAVGVATQRETQLRLTDRLKVIGTLAGGVGHEINNPLTYIIGNLGLIADMADEVSAGKPDWHREFLELIQEVEEGVNRIREIVRDLKTFSDPDKDRVELIDMRRVIHAMVSMARNEIRHRAVIEREMADNVPPVLGNVARVGQVILNLLINAAQALPVGESTRQTIRISLGRDGDRVVIKVSDTGPGIPEDIRARIFDPFFSTKEVGVGSGLGLAMCHSIVTSMGGEIAVDSEPGQGATFSIWLPIARRPDESRRRRLSQPPPIAARILVVDDEPGVVAMLRRALEGHFVDEAKSGQEAIDRLGSEPFDLVLCDLMMPDVSGMEVFRQVRDNRPGDEARIAFITGGAFTPVAQEFLRDNEPPCLEKPFTMTAVRTFVDRLLSRRRRSRR